MSVTVRYFAGAAEAAGVATETLDDDAARTAGDLRAAVVAAHGPELGRVLGRCSLLAAGRRLADDAAPVPPGSTVDVLPPFAGG
ncbi:MoaD/ThiS family protein [Cellulomonas sp. ATA003]|uniref:MoaD/ThiS family protein n=1 Tax=Cellulomonas sp. ATA003 TaxID=3073064 RepID=UPI002873C478|nr:MoaD/ThiS family protein [Cellulomonas sp. ATA003]WNB86934.1 MoaD/ThiS family protein [Cellulomonas sp. ATA003]